MYLTCLTKDFKLFRFNSNMNQLDYQCIGSDLFYKINQSFQCQIKKVQFYVFKMHFFLNRKTIKQTKNSRKKSTVIFFRGKMKTGL